MVFRFPFEFNVSSFVWVWLIWTYLIFGILVLGIPNIRESAKYDLDWFSIWIQRFTFQKFRLDLEYDYTNPLWWYDISFWFIFLYKRIWAIPNEYEYIYDIWIQGFSGTWMHNRHFCSMERIFSKSGQQISDRRINLQPTKIMAMMFLNTNQN